MTSDHSIANMEGLQAAITNGETQRVKELLGDQALDKLQKKYLIELAELNGSHEIADVLKNTPAH
ncbi:hypothetical protein [Alteromonas halophila]|uniref:Uncharacterized protein n=1 Tax=Alteromonas halophila TaxID=516698 RepID=A0A918JGB6_9ALTE|nr:hypothetical protein [Alteromonas halophila]GGW74704.1 hypothetical protein GCM10007391_03410 [Alteromonas halophila]